MTEFKCATCEHAVFDELWGEWKCKAKHHKIYIPEEAEACDEYKGKKEK